jgi:hypothetical protein
MGEETVDSTDENAVKASKTIDLNDYATGNAPRPDLFAHLRDDEAKPQIDTADNVGPRPDLFAHLREDDPQPGVSDLRSQIQNNVKERAGKETEAEEPEPVPAKKDQTTAYDEKPPAEMAAARALSGQDDADAKKEGLSILRRDKSTGAKAATSPKKVKQPERPSTPPPSVSSHPV